MSDSSSSDQNSTYLENLDLSEAEKEAIKELNSIKKFPKGTILIKEGEYSSKSFYVIKGCVRKYYLKDGEEKTTHFYTEEHSILPTSNSETPAPSKHYLECLEDCEITMVTVAQEKELYRRFPKFKGMCLTTTEESLIEFQKELDTFIMSSPEERYLNLRNKRPELFNRVPQYQLASYLGITPESLSRIKKRTMKKWE